MESEQPVARKGVVYRFTTAIDNVMRKFFFRVGYFVAGRPLFTILATVIVTGFCLLGMLRFRSEARSEKLWVPQNTVALDNLAYVEKRFGESLRVSQIVFTGKSEANVATRDAMLEMVKIAEEGFNVVGPEVDGKNVTFRNACLRTFDTKKRPICSTISPFDLFYNASDVVQDSSGKVDFYASVSKSLRALTDEQVRKRLEKGPFLTASGAPIIPEDILGKRSGTGASFSVNAMLYTQLTISNSVVKNGEEVDEANFELEKAWTKKLLDNPDAFGVNLIKWKVQSTYSQLAALGDALSGDLPLFSIGFILLTIYVVLYLGDFHAIRSRQVLGLVCLLNAGLSLGATFGISSALGMFFGPVHQVLPLLIIGIGVDDVFVVTRALDEVNQGEKFADKPVRTRVALALSNAGSAITVTSITNIIVFVLGSISRLPALRLFALWAAIGVAFDWIFTITFYTAALTLDTRRQNAKRRDCCPCFPPMLEPKELNWFKKPPGGFTRFFRDSYGPLILSKYLRIVLITLFLGLFGVCIWGCTQLYLKFDFTFFYPKGSDQLAYQTVVDANFKTGDIAPIYLSDTNISTAENQRRYIELCHPETGVIAKNKYIQNGTVDCWYHTMREERNVTGNNVIPPATFYADLKTFLNSSAGARYRRSIFFDKNGVYGSARFDSLKVYTASNSEEIDALLSIRQAADSVGFGKDDKGNPKAFTFSFQDTFTEQYQALPKEIALSLGLASAAVAIICFQLVGHPLVAIICVLVVGMTIIDVLAFTYFSGVNINSVSVITIVISTGIAVDYVVHIARSFLEQVGTRKERTEKALGALGPPVFYAAFSTFLAIIVLAFATSYIFNVLFLGFLELILIGVAHGLIFSPLILSLVGPPSFYATEEEKEAAEESLIIGLTEKSQDPPLDPSDTREPTETTSTQV